MDKCLLHAVTSGNKSVKEVISICKEISPFIDSIHIREHKKTAREIYEIGKELIESGIPVSKLIVNNRVDAAAALGITRVQLGFHSLPVSAIKNAYPELSIGKSVHSMNEALAAEEEGADSLLYGHVYPTLSKEGLQPRGLEELRDIADAVSIPVFAIGGIKPSNVKEVEQTGCYGVTIMSGIFNAEKPSKAAYEYKNQLERMLHE
ncbi:thiazole tautomerase TenI [Rossellomorea vietnamensis]|uniref:Thiazole tautomerase TenI n=2 Tax=Rossellomorea TaxID=2837508 RepID=A0A5D4KCR6_9BACI|nr:MULTISPECIES: thiazole tautomerase TenI [Rossellomorea]TYR75128.1 thiazole tautomerase TenI [Rossellomorea vietnamensis]TYS79885.1 thiazole tautomerase TenI [Rossellomorea aquimaris]